MRSISLKLAALAMVATLAQYSSATPQQTGVSLSNLTAAELEKAGDDAVNAIVDGIPGLGQFI